MDLNRFKFDSPDTLSDAKKYLKKKYPNIAVTDNLDTLTLAVESKNSLIFDTRITAIIIELGGTAL